MDTNMDKSMKTGNVELTSLSEVGDAVLMSNDPHSGSHIQVYEGGRKYSTTLTRKFLERKPWKASDPNEVRSFIPGEVSALSVKQGGKVHKGDTMMVYEAMKMKNIIAAPFDAHIEEIFVKVGDKLPKGALLLKLAPIE